MIKRGHDIESAPSIGMSAPISSCESKNGWSRLMLYSYFASSVVLDTPSFGQTGAGNSLSRRIVQPSRAHEPARVETGDRPVL